MTICFVMLFIPEQYTNALAVRMNNFVIRIPSLLDLLTLITYQFLHAGLDHFLGNFMFAGAVSIYAEKRLGSRSFIRLWLWSGVMSAVGFMLVNLCTPNTLNAIISGIPVGLIGASGSISGIYAYSVLSWGKKWYEKTMGYLAFLLFIVPQIMMMIAAVSFPERVAYSGHVFGAIGAIIYMACTRQEKKK